MHTSSIYWGIMQLTQHTDYAIRVLLYAAAHPERLVNITEIAEFYRISRSHLAKVVASLTQKEYLQGVRGKNGGLKLACQPNQINLGDLVNEFEPLVIVECFGQKNDCVITSQCQLKNVLNEAKTAFLTVLKKYTLADIQLSSTANDGGLAPLVFQPANVESIN